MVECMARNGQLVYPKEPQNNISTRGPGQFSDGLGLVVFSKTRSFYNMAVNLIQNATLFLFILQIHNVICRYGY